MNWKPNNPSVAQTAAKLQHLELDNFSGLSGGEAEDPNTEIFRGLFL